MRHLVTLFPTPFIAAQIFIIGRRHNQRVPREGVTLLFAINATQPQLLTNACMCDLYL